MSHDDGAPCDAELDLAGRWLMREAIGETWRWYASAAAQARNSVRIEDRSEGWIAATVPGSVVDALARADALPDPRRGFGSRASEWTGSRHWVLSRTVVLDERWVADGVTLLVDGIDPGGRVLLDGTEVAQLDGLYDVARVPLPVDRAGAHTIVVVIDPVPPGVPQVGRTSDVRRHAPRLGHGWDFCPPFPHQGIWRGLRLVRGPAPLDLVVTAECGAGDSGAVVVEVRTNADDGSTAEVTIAGDACAPTSARAVVRSGRAQLRLPTTAVRRWWPLGMGAQPLATVAVRIGDVVSTRRTGFRTQRWVRTPGSPDDALPYGLSINEQSVPLTGVNWAPVDAQLSEPTPQRITHLLDLAVAARARLLRIWGGGVVESEELYDAADERGLLVWQEFSQSSSGLQSAPSADPAYLSELVRDARVLVPARRHHPSLVLWGGGNELEDDAGPLRTEASPALAALAAVVEDLDPSRGWLPTSPSGGDFHHRLDDIRRDPERQHDVHGPWELQGLTEQHTLANAGTAIAHTEFGAEGAANERAHARLVPAELAWPADRTSAIHRHLGEWWNNATQVSELFGGIGDLATLRRASQWLQAYALSVAVEADRRRWPRTSMVLPWQLAESYPNAWCTALVDFLGEPKPALAALARTFADERVSLRATTSAWAGHDTVSAQAWTWSMAGRPSGGHLTLQLLDPAGLVLDQTVCRLDAVAEPRPSLELTARRPEGIFLWRALWTDPAGRLVDDERVVHTGGADMRDLLTLPATTLAVSTTPEAWQVRNTGSVAVVGLAVHDHRPEHRHEPLAALADPRPILPGETADVVLVSGTAHADDLVVDAFNLPSTGLPALSARVAR